MIIACDSHSGNNAAQALLSPDSPPGIQLLIVSAGADIILAALSNGPRTLWGDGGLAVRPQNAGCAGMARSPHGNNVLLVSLGNVETLQH